MIELAARPRLAKSLKPSRGTLEVAAIERHPPPHHDHLSKEKPSGPSQERLERYKRGEEALERLTKARILQQKQQSLPAESKPQTYSTPYRKEHNLDFDATASSSEFYNPPTPVTTGGSTELGTLKGAPGRFTSPPLLPGFVSALKEMLGSEARPTPIQSLSMKWLFDEEPAFEWGQFLLASETGSGKSIAYLLPMLQRLKETESNPRKPSSRTYSPRAIVLAPTHELSRQLTRFAKSLLHHEKLRVVCASQANNKTLKPKDLTASEMEAQYSRIMAGEMGEISVSSEKEVFPVDVMVGTPMKIMEMVRGRGWDRLENAEDVDPKTLRRGRDKLPGVGRWRSKPELGLENVEWVIVDEADVLLGE